MSIFGVKTTDAKREKLPTIRQFVKQTTRSKYKSDGVVELVWIPGKFRNFTLQTDSFRILVSEKHEFFEGLGEIFRGSDVNACGIRVEVSDWKGAAYTLHELLEDDGYWEPIGDSGYRYIERK